MSRATTFFDSTTPAPSAHAPAPKPQHPADTRDADKLLYKELLAALGRRGLTTIHHPCDHCQKLTPCNITQYPEVRMACRDAVNAWLKTITAAMATKLMAQAGGKT